MANQGAKKRQEENARHLKNLGYVIIICNVIYLVVRAGIMHSSFKWKHLSDLILTSFAYFIPYQQLYAMSRPTYGDDGELIDAVYDLSAGGICEYLQDLIYITGFIQLSSIFVGKFWYIYLAIPAYAAYKIFVFVRGFSRQGSEGVEEDEKTRKKMEKLEKTA